MPQSRKRNKTPESHPPEATPVAATGPAGPSLPAVIAALAGMLAAWSAAGSLGLMSHALRHGISWLGLGVLLIAAWPRGFKKGSGTVVRSTLRAVPATVPDPFLNPIVNRTQILGLVAAAVVAVWMTASAMPVCNVLAITLLLAILAKYAGPDRQLLEITSLATAVLGIYRLAMASIPTVWSLADVAGRAFGEVSETFWGRPLALGETFAGLDFLVLMFALYAGWLVHTSTPRLSRAILAAAGILLGHFAYLFILSCSHAFIAALPEVPPVPTPSPFVPPEWQWSEAVRTLLPWNLPIVAGVIHLSVAALMFRWAKWLPDLEAEFKKGSGTVVRSTLRAVPATVPDPFLNQRKSSGQPAWRTNLVEYGPAILAGLIPLLVILSWGASDLKGTKIVAHDQGYLDWLKPRHGSYGRALAGMYGMLPTLVESLGGEFARSEDLAAADLADADILLLIHPNRPWSPEQLDRVWDFVRGGGSLLLAAEPAMYTGDHQSSFNELLQPTRIEVHSDTAISQIGLWEQSFLPLAHPATTGLDGDRNQFGQMMGSSLAVRWPASPILVGRWGFGDPGSDAVHTGAYSHDPGEKLGDLILAAEDRIGRGKVIVLGDTASISNQMIGRSYPFIGRMLAYLAGRSSSPQAGWRQTLGLLACLALIGLCFIRTDCEQLATVAVVMTLSLWGTRALGHQSTRVLPDGRAASPNNVAYIDASHVEAYCDEPWGNDGIDGLFLTLMRNGYLPLLASDLAADRLEKSAVLISIAPARPFSDTQRRTVREFVEAGGIFISTVGAEHAGPSGQLLADFGFGVSPTHLRAGKSQEEPEPLGCVQPVYLDLPDRQISVMLFAGWPIRHPAQGAQGLAHVDDGSPVIAVGYFGKGTVVLIGDSCFAMNKNLERVDGEPLFGHYDNPDFWRWMLADLTDRPKWIPPKREPPARPESNSAGQTTADQASGEEESP
jgi:uncharacterized protein DUF4350